jgi:hypothetical protein
MVVDFAMQVIHSVEEYYLSAFILNTQVPPALCVYNSETTPPDNLECRAEEKMTCLRIQMVA